MLFISTRSKPEGYEWNVGRPVPSVRVGEVVEIQADGDELSHIDSTFSGTLPVPKKSVAHWYGDLARTIYLNLG